MTVTLRALGQGLVGIIGVVWGLMPLHADSINSPNITLNVDTNRVGGAGAGGVSVVINTVTLAEISLPEYSSGSGRAITFQARPGYQFDPASTVTAQSATIGFNGGGINAAAAVTPTGAADEIITFNLTSGTDTAVQDIIRVNGIRVRILSAAGAAGPAQTTLQVTTSTAGGAFTDQGIVAANITKGAADHLEFAAQPGSTQTGGDLLPAVRIVDFGGNILTNETRAITLALQVNPAAAVLLGVTQRTAAAGVATWEDADDLRLLPAAAGYVLRATHDGANFLTSDTVDSDTFEITAGAPDHMVFSLQPVDTVAGGDILVAVTVKDQAENTVTAPPVSITLDSAVNPGGWPLLVASSLTKETVNGIATWDAADDLRINSALLQYRLRASGAGAPIETNTFAIRAGSPASLRFLQQPTTTQEDVSIAPPVSVQILDQFANLTDSALTVDLTLQSGCGGTLSGGSDAASGGVAVFDALRIDTPCANVLLEAAAGNLPRANSDAFEVTALPPAALRFVQQPVDVEQGVAINPPISVEIIDASGKRTDSGATVQLTLVSSCGGGLSTSSVAAVGGLATFAIVSIDTPCPNVTLQATAAGLTGATSDTFDVTETVEDETPPPDEDVEEIACGACGEGAALALAPMLLTLLGMKSRTAGRTRR